MNSTEHAQKILEMEKSLRYISHIVKQRGREILNNYPITPPQFIALQWLRELGDLTIGELSKKMYLAFSTTTDLVDRMEKNELIVRIRDPKDRRVVRIHLLDKGRDIINEVIQNAKIICQIFYYPIQQTNSIVYMNPWLNYTKSWSNMNSKIKPTLERGN